MHALAELQADFARCIFDPRAGIPARLASQKQSADNSRRFGIYRNNVIASLMEAMGDNFPVIKKLVGDEFFAAIARLWILNSPPKYPMLYKYGEGFAEFLDCFEPVKALPYLGDVARLEQVLREAHFAPDAAALPIRALQKVGENELTSLVVHLHPSAGIVRSPHPVHTLWEYNTKEKPCKELDLQDLPGENIFIVRPQLDVHHYCISTAQAVFIAALLRGSPFGEAANLAYAQPGFELAATLGFLFHCGGVSDLLLTGK